jgi:hypothetical protein
MSKARSDGVVDAAAIFRALDRRKLAEAMADLREKIRRLRGELQGLKILDRAAAARDGQLPEKRKTSRPKHGGEPTAFSSALAEATKRPPLESLIVKFLADRGGPAKPAVIASSLAQTATLVLQVLEGNPRSFVRIPTEGGVGWDLAPGMRGLPAGAKRTASTNHGS